MYRPMSRDGHRAYAFLQTGPPLVNFCLLGVFSAFMTTRGELTTRLRYASFFLFIWLICIILIDFVYIYENFQVQTIMGVSKNNGTPHFNRVFHYKPSILGYPYFSLLTGPGFWGKWQAPGEVCGGRPWTREPDRPWKPVGLHGVHII